MTNISTLIVTANFEYTIGNISSAKRTLDQIFPYFDDILLTPEHPLAMDYLKALTLAQSVASISHDLVSYEFYEPNVKKWMYHLFSDLAPSYYGLHLTDACECYITAGDTARAQELLLQGIALLEEENGPCPLLSLIYYYLTAKLHFQMQQYYHCINAALQANNYFSESPIIPEDASLFLQQCVSEASFVTKYSYSNLILLACALGKINNPNDGIPILTELLSESLEDYYLRISAEITLAELYIYAGEYTKAREIYFKYKPLPKSAYPDLHMALSTLGFTLETSDSLQTNDRFVPEFDGQFSTSFCYSKDSMEIVLYNQGLKLISAGQYSQALALYRQLDKRGLSLQLYLLAKTKNYGAIPSVKEQADLYFVQEIRSLFLYYNEKYVYNHLSLLEIHFSLCMDAYIQCLNHLGSEVLPPEQIYDFLLNTKHISLEATYLTRCYQTLEDINNRQAFTSKDIQQCLSTDTALLEYCLIQTLDSSYYCVFIITTDAVTCVSLAEQAAIDELLDQWHILIQTPAHASALDPVNYEHDQKKNNSLLRRNLFRPIKDILSNANISNLIIAPAAELVHFSFACLSTSSTSYLEDSYKITYINTGKELITNPYLTPSDIYSALVVGNPEFKQYPQLPYAEEEAKTVAQILDVTCFTGKDVDLTFFDSCMDFNPMLLHLATHGIFEEHDCNKLNQDYNTAYTTMENSGLVLSDDILLSCNHVMTMDYSNTFLTVLSACQTGKGMFHVAEGVYGLRRAFRLAGCHSMIISLWQVDDRSGCLFMQYFYEFLLQENYHAKKAFFLALSALKKYEEKGNYPFSSPYYWAGYIFME